MANGQVQTQEKTKKQSLLFDALNQEETFEPKSIEISPSFSESTTVSTEAIVEDDKEENLLSGALKQEEAEVKIESPPPDDSFNKKAFKSNVENIALETTNLLKRKYGTEDVKVIPNGLERDMRTQHELYKKGATKGGISTHNYGAGADFLIFINGVQVTGTKGDSSLHEGTEPYQILGGVAKKHGYFWGWKDDSGHVAKTRFVHQFIDKYPDQAFSAPSKAFYEANKDTSTLKAKPLMEKLDEIYGSSNPNREYTGEEMTIDPLLEPIYIDAINIADNKTTEDNMLNSEVSRIESGESSIGQNNMNSSLPPLDISEDFENTFLTEAGEDTDETDNTIYISDEEMIEKSDVNEILNLPTKTIEKLADDLRTNGTYSYVSNADVAPEHIVANFIKNSNYTLSNAPEKDSWSTFKEAVREHTGDDSIEGMIGSGWNPYRELMANGIIGMAEMGVGLVDFLKTGGEAVFMPEKADEFMSMAGGMLWMMYEEPSNLITATGWDPRPDRNRFSEEGMKRVEEARRKIWMNPIAPIAVAAGWKAVPRQFHVAKVKMVEQLNKAEGALRYLENKQAAKKTIEYDPRVEFTPEMIELAEHLEATSPKFRQALKDKIKEAKQMELDFQEAVNPPKKKPSMKTDPDFKLPLDEPIPTTKKAPTKKQIEKSKKAESTRVEKRREERLTNDHEMLRKNLTSLEEQLKNVNKENLTDIQVRKLESAKKATQELLVKTQKEMVARGIKVLDFYEANMGLSKAQARWVYNRILKGGRLGVSKFNRFIGKGIEGGPYLFSKNNEHYSPEVGNLSARLRWQNNKQKEIGNGMDPTAWDKFQREFFDINYVARKRIMNSDASIAVKTEALANLELIRGASAKTTLELKNAVNTIEKGLKKADIDQLNGIVQFRREIAIYKSNQKKIRELPKEIEALKKEKRTAEIAKKIKDKKKKLKNAQDYKHSLQYKIDPVTLKRTKTEDGSYFLDDPNTHVANMQRWIAAVELENPKLKGKADSVFEIYRKNLNEMQKYGEEYFAPEQFNELSMWDYQQKQYIDKLVSYKGDYRQLGSGVIKGVDEFTKGLKAGDAGPIMNDWKYNLGNALNIKNQILFENRANSGLAKFIDQMPDNGFAKKVKKGDKIPADWRVVEYKIEGKSHKIALEKNFYDSWIKGDAQIASNLAKNIQFWSGNRLTKLMATGAQPSFAIKNLPRDIMYTYFKSDKFSKHIPIFAGQMMRAYSQTFMDAVRRKGQYIDYTMEGGGMSWLSTEGFVKGKNKHLNYAKEVLGYVGETSEIWTRLAVRNQAMYGKNGLSPRMATAHARGIMDFNSGGRTIKAMDNGLPYLNASMVAARGMGRAFYRNPKDFLIKSAYVAGSASIWWAYNKRFAGDMTSQIHPREAYDYHIVFIPGSLDSDKNGRPVQNYIRIPKDSMSKPISAVVDWQMEDMFGDKQRADKLFDIVKYSINEFSPLEFSKSVPPLAGAIIGEKLNRNVYTKYDIWKGDKAVHKRSQVTDKEDEWVRDLSDTWNDIVGDDSEGWQISPAKLQNALGELAIPHNDFVKIAANVYASRKRDKYGEESIKSYEKEVKTIPEDLSSPFLKTTKAVNQQLVTEAKELDADVKTRNEEYSQMVDKILALDKKGVFNGDEKFKEFIKTDVTDPIQIERLTNRYFTGKKTGNFVSEAEWLIKRTKNYSAPAKALLIYHELHYSSLSQESKDSYWQELIGGEYLNEEVFLYYNEYVSSNVQKSFIKQSFGEEEYNKIMDRVNRLKPRDVLNQEELELNKGKKFIPITTDSTDAK